MPDFVEMKNAVARATENDIVTRLRLLSASQKAHRFADLLDDWSGEAADEIERLRTELREAQSEIQRLTHP